ncbi:PRC-barrel domain-containing protein [Kineosporia succinea]|uniref:Sporulation protein YlmC with PRC-barrel domain n=1 Tax=Kineosporia succinea TaxID=84632 RepID=A0ABT9NW32_9ACTN|nr:PRC-barrel domain-containing protein [Kineosporia succinea]MDP9824636.1 sporulation protein YlmC with PRC-barrel domain [Kineosporia succinea]
MDLKPEEARDLVGRTLHDVRGERLGDVSGVYFNDAGHDAEWLSVTDGENVSFVPASALTSDASDQLSLTFDRGMLDNQPKIEPHDGALSNAQVARLHEFFHTFDGRTRITSATSGAAADPSADPAETPFTGRAHEAVFGTGTPAPGEPHDVTLQGNGNFAP